MRKNAYKNNLFRDGISVKSAEISWQCFKKSLKPESVNQRRTENTMANEKGKKDKQSSIKHYT